MNRQKPNNDDDLTKAVEHVACAIHEGLLAVARSIGELKPTPGSQKKGLWLFSEGHDEPIEKVITMEVTLSKPIKPGFRRAFSVNTDEAVDKQDNGSFARTEMVTGDSTAPTINDETSTEKQIHGWVNGDGSLGSKQARVLCDGHVGEGDVPIELVINYEVAHPDATSFENFKEGADEAIPTPTTTPE